MPLPSGRRASRGWVVVALCSAVVLSTLAVLVAAHWQPLMRADRSAEMSAHHAVLAHPALLRAFRDITHFGDALVADIVAAVAALALAVRRRWNLAAGRRAGWPRPELAGTNLAKWAVHRPRPALSHPVAHATGFSFPSGHASTAAAVYGVVTFLVVRRAGARIGVVAVVLCSVLVLAVAASRVFLGVHFSSDAAGGILLGVGWLAICLRGSVAR